MWLEFVRMAASALLTHKFRSFLTVSSIVVGAFSIVFMTSLAESGGTTLAKGIEDVGGARLLIIHSTSPEKAEKKQDQSPLSITLEDRDALYAALPHLKERSMYASLEGLTASNERGESHTTDLVATDSGLFGALHMPVRKGRSFTEEEQRARAKVCVVGDKLATALWPAGDALGRRMVVDGIPCSVIGELSDAGHFDVNFGFDWRDVVILPFQTVAECNPRVQTRAGLVLITDASASNDIVKRIAHAVLSQRHHGVDDFRILDFAGIMQKFAGIFLIMEVIIGLIAGIALLVGGVGVMNMMLVAVSERVREIGLCKALGARPSAIGGQFLCEAALLSGTGGLIGVLGGVATALLCGLLLKQWQPVWTSVISQGAVATALGVSIALGLGFGYFPARRASRLDPVVALRR